MYDNSNHRNGRSNRSYRGGGRNTGRERGGRSYHNNENTMSSNSGRQPPVNSEHGIKICTYYARGKSCQYGESCRFSHHISVSALTQAHEQSVTTACVLPSPFRLLTGSRENGIKVWTIDSNVPREEVKIPTQGPVQRIEVNGTAILWSAQAPLINEIADSSVGMLYLLLDPGSLATIAVKRSELIPFTHAIEVGYFTTAVSDGTLYVISGGGDAIIRTWKYNQTTNSFEHLLAIEGHGKGITSLLMCESKVWSASLDSTIRLWDVSSGRCDGVLSSTNEGHTSAVCCLKLIPPVPPNNTSFIASGGCDGFLKIWNVAGNCLFSLQLGEGILVTALEVFSDELGGQPVLLVGLSDGRIVIISCRTMKILYTIDSIICTTTTVNCIVSIGSNRFISVGDDGQLIIWQVDKLLIDTQ